MAGDGDLIEQAKQQAFGDKAKHVRVEVMGSGISETTRMSLDLLANPDVLATLPPPWTENQAMIVRLFTPTFRRSNQCPGRDQPQCCRADGDWACFPNWQEREDPEWFAQEINKYLSLVNTRIGQEGPLVPPLAADEAFELGCLFTEALIKLGWDKHAKRGKKTADSAKSGGEAKRNANQKRLCIEETVAAVDALIAQKLQKKAAYLQVGEEQGVSDQTIRKEYRNAKKER